MVKKNITVNFLGLVLLFFSALAFAQNAAQAYSQDVAQRNYDMQISKGAYDKAITEMINSSSGNSIWEAKELNDDFEFNFAAKGKIEAKLKASLQKRVELEKKLSQAKNGAEKDDLRQKLERLNLDIEKLKNKLVENEAELKTFQQSYKKLIK